MVKTMDVKDLQTMDVKDLQTMGDNTNSDAQITSAIAQYRDKFPKIDMSNILGQYQNVSDVNYGGQGVLKRQNANPSSM